jgi:hypothetical protein
MGESTFMKFTLTLDADAWQGERRLYEEIIGYRVGGLPAGEKAGILKRTEMGSDHWRILRMKNDLSEQLVGNNHRSPEEALAWLQGEVDNEQAG